jgi:hypothetical protein
VECGWGRGVRQLAHLSCRTNAAGAAYGGTSQLRARCGARAALEWYVPYQTYTHGRWTNVAFAAQDGFKRASKRFKRAAAT